MTTPGQPGNINYQVIGTTPGVYDTNAMGDSVIGTQVHYKLSTGGVGSIFVPGSVLPPVEDVAPLVQQAAANLAAIHGISGQASQ